MDREETCKMLWNFKEALNLKMSITDPVIDTYHQTFKRYTREEGKAIVIAFCNDSEKRLTPYNLKQFINSMSAVSDKLYVPEIMVYNGMFRSRAEMMGYLNNDKEDAEFAIKRWNRLSEYQQQQELDAVPKITPEKLKELIAPILADEEGEDDERDN